MRMTFFAKLILVAIGGFLIIVIPNTALAQEDSTFKIGIWPHGSYQGGNVDVVDLQSGNVVVKIPLFSLPQKGNLSLSFSAVLNNPQYARGQLCDTSGEDCIAQYYQASNPGPNIVVDQMVSLSNNWYTGLDPLSGTPTYTLDRFGVSDSSGASHTFGWDSLHHNMLSANDGSGYRIGFNPSTTSPPGALSGPLLSSTGNTYSFANPIITSSLGGVTPTAITDVFGNSISISGMQVGNWNSIIDSELRSIPGPLGTGPSGVLAQCPSIPNQPPPTASSLWQVPGPNGAYVTYQICSALISYNTHIPDGGDVQAGIYTQAYGLNSVIQSIVLPDKTYWAFSYDTAGLPDYPWPDMTVSQLSDWLYQYPVAYGTLTSLTYPAGATTTYTYETRDTCSGRGASLSAVTRQVNDGGGNASSQWRYSEMWTWPARSFVPVSLLV